MMMPTKSAIAASGCALDHWIAPGCVGVGGASIVICRDRFADVLDARAIEQRRLVRQHRDRRAAAVAIGGQAADDLRMVVGCVSLRRDRQVEPADVDEAEAVVERGAQVVAARRPRRPRRSCRTVCVSRGVGRDRRGQQLVHERVPREARLWKSPTMRWNSGSVASHGRRVHVVAELLRPRRRRRAGASRACCAKSSMVLHRRDDAFEREQARLLRSASGRSAAW